MARRKLGLAGAILWLGSTGGCAPFDRPGAGESSASTSAAVAVSEASGCAIELTKLSYDDPGVDDAELVELFVDLGDAASKTLGECGLASVESINGIGCSTIAAVDVAALPVPADGYVLFCSGPECDVRTANGWLQNGAPDALHFLGANRKPLLSVVWEGALECGSGRVTTAQTEVAAGPDDDVNVWCSDRFVLKSLAESPTRRPNACDASDASDGDALDGATGDADAGEPCRVEWTKLDYENPGQDDGELIELRVDGPGAALGDCGLGAIRLFNGSPGDPCSPYLELPLLDAGIPEDGYVVVCAPGSSIAKCDVTSSAGGKTLENGWLQNGGPGASAEPDIVGLYDTAGQPMLFGVYEGAAPDCLDGLGAAPILEIPSEGATSSDAVNVRCEDGFVLLAADAAPLREPNVCPEPDGGDGAGAGGMAGQAPGGAASGGNGGAAHGSGGASGSGGTSSPPGGTGTGGAIRDAGASGEPASPRSGKPPDALGCACRAGGSRTSFALSSALIAAVWLVRRARRPGRSPEPHRAARRS